MAAEPISIARPVWTVEDLAFFDDDVRRELDDGVIFQMPSPTLKHQDLVGRLYLFLMQWIAQNGGKAFLSPIDLVLSPTRVFIPDLVFYSAEKVASGEVERDPKRLRVPPDFVVEIISPSTGSRDRVLKYRRYAEFGVRHYWLVDPLERTFQSFQLEQGRYFDEATLADDEEFAPALFPNLKLSMSELFGPRPAPNRAQDE